MTQAPPDLTFGRRMRQAREDAGYTQARAALALGVSRPLLSHWERGTRVPRSDKLASAMVIYDAPWLLELVPDLADYQAVTRRYWREQLTFAVPDAA